jgi:hypothetical protein
MRTDDSRIVALGFAQVNPEPLSFRPSELCERRKGLLAIGVRHACSTLQNAQPLGAARLLRARRNRPRRRAAEERDELAPSHGTDNP